MARLTQKDTNRQRCCNALGIADLFQSPDQLRILRNARGPAFFYRAVSVLRSAGYSKAEALEAAKNIDLTTSSPGQ